MPAADDAFLLEPVPHEEAARWLEDKPVVSREVFADLLPELKARAFLVTGLEDANVAHEIRSLLAEVPRGADWDATRKVITAKLGPWLNTDEADGDKAAQARAEILLRTHVFQAYARTNHEVMRRQQDVFPYWQYLSSGDEKVRPAHAALNEVVAPADSDFWASHTPPWQWGCRCRKVALLPDEVDELKAADSGKPPETQRVLEGTALKLANEGRLDRGPNQQFDIRNDLQRGKRDGFHFDPDSLALPIDQLKARYGDDSATWNEFEAAAKRNRIDGGTSVWEWLQGKAVQTGGQANRTTPGGTPLKGKLKYSKGMESAEKNRVDRILAAIDSVHGDGPLQDLPVDNNPGAGSLGALFYRRDGTPVRIGFRKASSKLPAPYPELTLVHEIGHWLDLSGLGKGTFATEDLTGDLKEWWRAVENSAAMKSLRAMPKSGKRSYYTGADEVWARSYAQFIAEESGDALLLKQVRSITASKEWPEQHWSEADFAPIREQIRALFVKKGWMKKGGREG